MEQEGWVPLVSALPVCCRVLGGSEEWHSTLSALLAPLLTPNVVVPLPKNPLSPNLCPPLLLLLLLLLRHTCRHGGGGGWRRRLTAAPIHLLGGPAARQVAEVIEAGVPKVEWEEALAVLVLAPVGTAGGLALAYTIFRVLRRAAQALQLM